MNTFVLAFLGGIFGAVLTDIIGRRGRRGANALLASPLAHIPYGLGIGAAMALGTRFQ